MASMQHLRLLLAGALGAMLLLSVQTSAQQPSDVTVFAAASLTNALQEAAVAHAASGGARLKFSFASSSTLAKQIEAGAAAQLFLSADEAWMEYLGKRNLLVAGTRRALLSNRLVLVVPADKPVSVAIASDGTWLRDLPPGRISTGDPAHVPVGKYAQQALTTLRVWPDVEPRLARADNVRNALVLVERGEAVAGIVYSTDAAISKHVVVAGVFPETSHDPITYPIALVRPYNHGAARAFYTFLASSEARAIFTKHGFAVR
jgi:molybdate transport system substrate-binding protein